MNLKRMAVMFTIMLITVLSASCFYVFSDEKDISNSITVSKTDYEKVHGEGPYNDNDGKGNYYIRYTGALSGRTVVDLEDTNVVINGKSLGGCGVTKETDGTIKIFNQEIKSTYKMFSYIAGKTNTEITRVFVPASIAIDGDKGTTNSNGGLYNENKGIASNTFYGYESSTVEKDVIYHTGDVLTNDETKDAKGEGITSSLDRTSKINRTQYSHVTTYVYLGQENIKRTSKNILTSANVYSYAYHYNGQVSNVFLSNQVDYLVNFLGNNGSNDSAALLNYALLDDGKTWADNQRPIWDMFSGQTKLQLTENFKLPEKIYNGNNTTDGGYGLRSFFQSCTSLTKLPSDFTIPSNIENMGYMFYGCISLETLSNNFNIPNKTTDLAYLFYNCKKLKSLPKSFQISNNVQLLDCTFRYCESLTNLPENFTIPTSLIKNGLSHTFEDCKSITNWPAEMNIPEGCTYVGQAFKNCAYLKSIIKVPDSSTAVDEIFIGAGTETTSNLYGYQTPIVMKYYQTNSPSLNYTDNIFTSLTDTPKNKVTKVPVIEQSGWKTVSDQNANEPNSDDNGESKYYVNYTGSSTTIDLGDEDAYPLTSDGYPTICSTRVYSTYKMFSNNQTIIRVFVPASIAIKEDKIESNTFDGCTTQKAIDLIYHTGNLIVNDVDIDATGKGITSDYDKTSVFSNSSNAKAYVYLGDENIQRDQVSYTNKYKYLGDVKNIFISNEVKNPTKLCQNTSATPATLLNYALLDTGEDWANNGYGLWDEFCNQDNLKLTNNFKLPNTISNVVDTPNGQWGMRSMFINCKSLDQLPDNFTLPSNVQQAGFLFANCTNLKGTVIIPTQYKTGDKDSNGTTLSLDYYGMFGNGGYGYAGSSATGYAGNKPITVKCIKGSYTDSVITDLTYITKDYISASSIQSLSDVENATVAIINQVTENTEKAVIEAETGYITVTVTQKTVDEVVEETQTNSQSVESVNDNQTEDKSEEE